MMAIVAKHEDDGIRSVAAHNLHLARKIIPEGERLGIGLRNAVENVYHVMRVGKIMAHRENLSNRKARRLEL